MKNKFNVLKFVLLGAILYMSACNSSSRTDDNNANDDTTTNAPNNTDTSASANNPNATSVSAEQETIDFIVPANAKEMAWLQAAINNKTSSKQVKDHARSMLADHKKMGTEVANLVTQKNWTAPAADTTGAVTINDKTGKDWDKAWIDKMVADHAELFDRLTQAEVKVADPELKALAVKSKPVIEKHLNMVKAMQAKQ